jgi:hypothetical protein
MVLKAELESDSRRQSLRLALGGGARGQCSRAELETDGAWGQASRWRAWAELGDDAWRQSLKTTRLKTELDDTIWGSSLRELLEAALP